MIKKAILSILTATVILVAVHAGVLQVIGDKEVGFDPLFSYILFTVLSIGMLVLVNYVVKADRSKGGITFIGASTFQLLLSLGYLTPMILRAGENSRPVALHFMIPFAFYLVLEAVWAVRIISKK